MLYATDHLGGVGVGVTRAQLFRVNNDKVYVTKLQNNRLGPKVLVNEYLAARLGQMISLCFPPSCIIEIPENITTKDRSDNDPIISPGKHFASEYLDNVQYTDKDNLAKAANLSEMAGVMLFDHLFLNADRGSNKKNLLLRQEGSKHKIYAIDNSHIFRSGKWTATSLLKQFSRIRIYTDRSYGRLLNYHLSAEDFYPYLEKVKAITNDQIDSLIQSIPEEWLPDKSERQLLNRLIKRRLQLADQIWERICKRIPTERGGSKHVAGRIFCLTSKSKKPSFKPRKRFNKKTALP